MRQKLLCFLMTSFLVCFGSLALAAPFGGGPFGGKTEISDEAYGPTWDGKTTAGASKNAIYDAIEALVIEAGAGDITAVGDCSSGDCFKSGGTGTQLHSTDGSFTLGGVGGTNNEDIAIDFETNANQANISSSTGVTDLSWTGNLGLGTTAPQQKLDVRGNGLFLDSTAVDLGLPDPTSAILSVSEANGRVATGGIVGNLGEFSYSSTVTGVLGADIDIDFATSSDAGRNSIFKTSMDDSAASLSGLIGGSTSMSFDTSVSSETLGVDAAISPGIGDSLLIESFGKGSVALMGFSTGTASASVDSVESTPNITYAGDWATSSDIGQFVSMTSSYDNLTAFSVGGVGSEASGSVNNNNTTTGVETSIDFASQLLGGALSYSMADDQNLQTFQVVNDGQWSASTSIDNGANVISMDAALDGTGTFGISMDTIDAIVSGFLSGDSSIVMAVDLTPSLNFGTTGNNNFFEVYVKDADYTIEGDSNFALGSAIDGDDTAITGDKNFAIGQGLNITADNAFVLGKNVTSTTSNSLAIGFNATQSATTTLFVDGANSRVGIGTSAPASALTVASGDLRLSDGVVLIAEQAAADADIAGYGQLWVKTATPNELWFTDDAGTDFQLGVSVGSVEGTAVLSTGEVGGTKFLREDGDGTSSWQTITGGGDALVANPLSQFAATTSAQFAGVISDETGSGAVVLATSPTLVTPVLGVASGTSVTTGTMIMSDGLLDGVGAVDMDYGSADITDHTFITDGTGTAEIVLPAGAIDSTEILDGTIVVADTSITAGRSLTWSTNDLVADVELYTISRTWNYPENPVDTDDNKSIWCNDTANDFTVTKLKCESDQTVTMMLQVDDGTPADMDSVDLVCISTPDTDTSLDGDNVVAAGECVDVATTSVSGTPTWCSVTFTGTWND